MARAAEKQEAVEKSQDQIANLQAKIAELNQKTGEKASYIPRVQTPSCTEDSDDEGHEGEPSPIKRFRSQ
jgi:hypothetical protein